MKGITAITSKISFKLEFHLYSINEYKCYNFMKELEEIEGLVVYQKIFVSVIDLFINILLIQ